MYVTDNNGNEIYFEHIQSIELLDDDELSVFKTTNETIDEVRDRLIEEFKIDEEETLSIMDQLSHPYI